MKKRIILLIYTSLLFISIFYFAFDIESVNSEPATWTVDDDGPADFHTIQAAINAGDNGDTVYVKAGTYYEHVVVNKTMFLVGENKNATIVDGSGIGTVVLVSQDNVVIRSFTIRNGENGLILELCNNSTLKDNIFVNNTYNLNIGVNLSFDFSRTYLIQNIDTSNTVNGKPVYYWMNEHNKKIPSDAGFVAIINSTNITIENITLQNNSYGVVMGWSNNCTVRNITATNNQIGITLLNCHGNNVTGNFAFNSSVGIELWASGNNVLRNNEMRDNECNFGFIGFWLATFINDIDTSNKVDGKSVYYFMSKKDLIIDLDSCPDIGCLIVVNSTNVTVKNLELARNQQGLVFAYTNNSLIEDTTISNCPWGMMFLYSSNNIIRQNMLANNGVGIWLDSWNLTRSDPNLGINAWGYTVNNTIVCNRLQDCRWGISILWHNSVDNKIYHNDFINMKYGNTDLRSWEGEQVNIWDDGYPSGGNYWGEYTGVDEYQGPNQDIPGSDGLGDTPYVVDEHNQDNYPLMKPWNSATLGDINDDGTVDIFDAVLMAIAFGSQPGDPNWNPDADLNNDGIVDIFDVVLLAQNFGKTT